MLFDQAILFLHFQEHINKLSDVCHIRVVLLIGWLILGRDSHFVSSNLLFHLDPVYYN